MTKGKALSTYLYVGDKVTLSDGAVVKVRAVKANGAVVLDITERGNAPFKVERATGSTR